MDHHVLIGLRNSSLRCPAFGTHRVSHVTVLEWVEVTSYPTELKGRSRLVLESSTIEVRVASSSCPRWSTRSSSVFLDNGCMIAPMEFHGSRCVDHLAVLIASSVCRETSRPASIPHELPSSVWKNIHSMELFEVPQHSARLVPAMVLGR